MKENEIIKIKKKDLYYFISKLYDEYFYDYVYEVIEDEDEEKSVVVLFEGMNYCLDLCKKYNFKIPFESIEDYFLKEFEDGKEVYENLKKRFVEEDKIYYYEDKTFRERFTNEELIFGEE